MANAKMSQSGASWDSKIVFPTPLPLSEFLVVELVDRKLPEGNDLATGVALAYGTAHPNPTLFSGFKLTFERELNENIVERWYAKDRVETDQETYNSDIHYSGDANDYPIRVRNYLIPRASYAVEAKLTPDPIVASALLVKEDLVQTNDERLTGLYVAVQKTYETLPGPWLPDAIRDLLTGPVQRRRRAVVNTGQASAQSGLTTTTYQARDGSAIVSWEIEETFSDGTGVISCSAASALVASAGTGYAPANTVTLTGGTFTTATAIRVLTTKVVQVSASNDGSGGTPGGATLTGTTGTGTNFQVQVIIGAGGFITAIVGNPVVAGSYTVNPTNLAAEPVTGGGLTGATVTLTMGIETVEVSTAGIYSVPPSNPVAQGSTSGAGAGATFTLDYECNSNSLYPQVEGPIEYDAERGDVHGHSQLVRIIWKVVTATVVSGGTGGTPGAVTITGTTGTGTKFTATGTINGGGVLAGSLTIAQVGLYTVRPTNILIEPVTGGGLSNATVSLTLDATQQSSLTVTATLATLIDFEPFDEFRLKQVTRRWVLPGPITTTQEPEPESATIISTARRMRKGDTITTFQGAVGTAFVVTESQKTGIGKDLLFEVTTTIPQAENFSLETAMEEDEMRPYRAPGRININNETSGYFPMSLYGITISTAIHDPNPSADLINHTIKTFWVNSATKPTLSFDEIFPLSILLNDGDVTKQFNNVLHDAVDLIFGIETAAIPETVPSFTEFFDNWIGTPRMIGGNVSNPRRFRWKCTAVFVDMF